MQYIFTKTAPPVGRSAGKHCRVQPHQELAIWRRYDVYVLYYYYYYYYY